MYKVRYKIKYTIDPYYEPKVQTEVIDEITTMQSGNYQLCNSGIPIRTLFHDELISLEVLA